MAKTDYGDVEEGKSFSQEVTRKNKKNANVPGAGLYRHKESGQEAIVIDDPLWGNTQAQAFARLGFEFVRPAEEGEIKSLPELAAEARGAEQDSLKGLSARVNALEGVAEENKSLNDEVKRLQAELEAEKKARADAEKAASKADADAKKQVEEAGKANTTPAETESKEDAKANAEAASEGREAATGATNTKVTEKEGK